jgi:hypothetical protein
VTLTVIYRPPLDPVRHLPVEAHRQPQPVTVVRSVCGAIGIGPVIDRPEDVSCALCLAALGRHPGKAGKGHLRRLLEPGAGR